jgi:membrane protease YdiL (CAAX protease family)
MNRSVKFPSRYFIITFIWSWVLWGTLVLVSTGVIPVPDRLLSFVKQPVAMLGAFGPMAGALFALRHGQGKGSVRTYLKSFLDFRLGWKGWVYPIIIFGGSTFIAWFFPELLGEERLPMLLPSIWVFIPTLIFMVFLGGGQEEFGWRGYALPVLESKYGVWFANTLLGIIWGLWHLPLWFITGTSQNYMNFGGFVMMTIGSSFILSWIRKIAGNKPFAAMYAHGLSNAFIAVMPTLIMEGSVSQTSFWIWVTLTLVIGIMITAMRKKTLHLQPE